MLEEEIVDDVAQEESAPLTLREEIESAAKQVNEKAQEEVEEKASKTRNKTGKFSKTADTAESESSPKEKTVKRSAEQSDKPEQEQTQTKTISPPHTWTAAARAKWNEIPPDIQAEISRRESEVEKGFTRLEEDRNIGKSFKEVISPYLPIIQAEGGTPITAVKDLLNTAYILRTATPQKKGELIMQIAQQFGADLSQVSQSQPVVDPQLRTIQQEFLQLKNERQQEVAVREQREKATIDSAISTFSTDPKNIHFDAVKPHVIALLQGGQTKGTSYAEHLQDAYEQAIWARPDIRSTLLDAQMADKEAKRVAEVKAKAAAAHKASVSITGSPGAAAPSNPSVVNRSLREEIAANLRAVVN